MTAGVVVEGAVVVEASVVEVDAATVVVVGGVSCADSVLPEQLPVAAMRSMRTPPVTIPVFVLRLSLAHRFFISPYRSPP